MNDTEILVPQRNEPEYSVCPSGEKELFPYCDTYPEFKALVDEYIGVERKLVDEMEAAGTTENNTYWSVKEELRLKLARAGKANLFFLITECALYKRSSLYGHFIKGSQEVPDYYWGYERCKEIEPFENRFGYGDFWARGHLKTTIITEFLTIQDLLNDASLSFGLLAPNDTLAKEIINHIDTYLQYMQWIYPETIPENPRKVKAKRTETQITLMKNGVIGTRPSLTRITKTGNTGFHFDYIIYDDLMHAGIKDNPNLIMKVVQQVNSSMMLNTVRFEGSTRRRFIGTYYHKNDVWDILQKSSNNSLYIPRLRFPTVDQTKDGKLLFFTREQWNKLTRDTALPEEEIQAQYFMQPAQGESALTLPSFNKMVFHKSRIGEINATPYIMVDPAFSVSKNADYTGIVVFGYGADNKRYVYEAHRVRVEFMNLYSYLKDLVLQYSPAKVFIEANMSIETQVTNMIMARGDLMFDITAVSSKIPKFKRIASLGAALLQRQVVFAHDLRFEYLNEGSMMTSRERDGYEIFMKEYSAYVLNSKDNRDDLLDAMAYMFFIPESDCYYDPKINYIRRTPVRERQQVDDIIYNTNNVMSVRGSGLW